MKLVPTKGRIVVEKISEEKTTVSGLILTNPMEISDEIIKSVIVSAFDKVGYPVGSIVYSSKYSALPVKDFKTDKEYYILPETDVMAFESDEAEYASK